jgi:hypothetical protein
MKINKKILGCFLIFVASAMNAQIAVGKQTVNGNSTILDFAGHTATEAPTDQTTSNIKGIVLPAVEASPAYTVSNPATNSPNNGTFLFDRTLKMVRMFTNGAWVNLSDVTGVDIPTALVNTSSEVTGGVIIGATTTNALGVLVLESTDKALILPHVNNPHTSVTSPYPGMMCYDTVSNSLAVYDGFRWNYWK